MEPTSTSPVQRSLAAILFTDAVGYSTLAGTDEDLALKTVDRDFSLMESLAQQFEGRVVKNTGDGLLILFSSAAQAVGCAIEIQRQLAQQEADDPNGLHLPHRIGIHVGDVMLSENDAKGNGVNVAARLQAEARPGGIWISQTVFDLVKQTLPVNAVALGNKQLRNLPELVGVYELAVDTPRARQKVAQSRRVSVPVSLGVIGVLLVVVGLLAGYILRQKSERESLPPDTAAMRVPSSTFFPELDLSKLKDMGKEIEAKVPVPPATKADTSKESAVPKTEQKTPPQTPTPNDPSDIKVPDISKQIENAMSQAQKAMPPGMPPLAGKFGDGLDFQHVRDQANKELDYTPLLLWLARQKGMVGKSGFVDLAAKYGRLQNLWSWFEEQFADSTESNPYVVGGRLDRGGKRTTAWASGDDAVLLQDGAKRTVALNDLPRPMLSQMIFEAIRRDKSLDAEERQAKMSDLKLFVDEFKTQMPKPAPSTSVDN